MPMLQVAVLCLAGLSLSAALVCPDGGMCVEKSTCCRNTEGGYDCCPLPKAECCPDHIHCCYEGTVCDLPHHKCVNKTVSLPWVKRVPTTQRVKAVICPDMVSECPDDTTCCELADHSWGCCPLVQAVCCEDKRHCCPEGTQCDLVHSRCVSSTSESSPMLKKIPAKRRVESPESRAGAVTCPGGKSSCPDSYTCCLLPNGDYGCCPYPNAICCSDHVHCCPSNTVCDLKKQMCQSGENVSPLLKKIPSVPNGIMCPDLSQCGDEMTCCLMTTGAYACCPYPNAVCCVDRQHCCPHGTVCNLEALTCDSPTGSAVMPLVGKAPVEGSDNTKCDKSTECPGKTTCCKDPTGSWGCCPLPEAVCCDDHVHCCPHGTVCNLATETCDDPFSRWPSVSWAEKIPALSSRAENEKCDKQTMCPGGTTCCKKTSGQWACCPLPQAVCCSDHEHCCPNGYKCNVAEQTCDKPGEMSLSWVQKIPALLKKTPQILAVSTPKQTMCDPHTSCPRDTTCCFMKNTQKWGCCPVPHAICCEDGDHCCPHGHTCEPHRSSCSRGPHVIPWFTKLSAFNDTDSVTDVKCDDKTSCASGTTCCKLPTGAWGCCPLVKAVCCQDHTHCCPQSYTCNMETGTCEKTDLTDQSFTVPQLTVLPLEQEGPCDNTGGARCAKQDTCCRTSATEWACCPSPGAVCCPDLKHCCPAGFSCDLIAGSCIQQNQLSWDSFLPHRRDSGRPGL